MPVQKMLDELNDLRHDFLELSHCVEDAVADVYRESDPARDGGSPAERGRRIVARCQRVLLLYQPVAADFQWVTAVLAMATEFERAGNLVSGFAEWTDSHPVSPVPASEGLLQIAGSVTEICRLALDASALRTPASIRRAWRAKTEVTDLVTAFTGRLTGAMKADPEAVEPGLHLFDLVQCFRRIADHAPDLAEGVVLSPKGASGWSRSDVSRPVSREPSFGSSGL